MFTESGKNPAFVHVSYMQQVRSGVIVADTSANVAEVIVRGRRIAYFRAGQRSLGLATPYRGPCDLWGKRRSGL